MIHHPWAKKLIGLLLLVASCAGHATDIEPLDEFRALCRERISRLESSPLASPIAPGTLDFFPLGQIVPGQARFSHPRYLKGMKKSLKNYPGPELPYSEGRSAHPLEDPAFGVAYNGKIYLFEGHHQILVNIVRGGAVAPVQVLADWTCRFTHSEFEVERLKQGLSYQKNAAGKALPALSWCDLIDDPNLQLARLLILKVKAQLHDGKAVVNSVKGAAQPLVIKLNVGLPFEELIIADALTRASVKYDGQELTHRQLKFYLKILKSANARLPRAQRLILVEKVRASHTLRLENLLHEPLRQRNCALALDPSAAIVP